VFQLLSRVSTIDGLDRGRDTWISIVIVTWAKSCIVDSVYNGERSSFNWDAHGV